MSRSLAWLHHGGSALAVLAVIVGAGAGAGAVLFRYLILWTTEVFSGHADYSSAGRVSNPNVLFLGVWFVVLAPVVGGLLYGPLVDRFAREARGHGVPEVMLAVQARGGRIKPEVAAVKALASALCIGSGGSVGREGPIVQIGSALGSSVGQLLRAPETRVRLLVACGAAGGISATFNAPIAGVFFALEVILGTFATESFGVVVLASVTASVIGRAAFGSAPFLVLPAFRVVSPLELGLYAILGVACAAVGVLFTRVLYAMEDLVDRVWRWSEAWRPAALGALLGLLLLAFPQMYGVGYPVLENAVHGHYVASFLLLLLIGKIAATSLTIGIGGSGGVFAPSLFMGAMVGTAFGAGVHHLFPGSTAPPGAYGLVAMGAVFAGAARAPITAVLIVFELTGDYQIVLPLMVAVAIATGVSHLLTADTIYTLKLRRRGIDLSTERTAGPLELITVREAMSVAPVAIRDNAHLRTAIRAFTESGRNTLPVVDGNDVFLGCVTARDVERAAQAQQLDLTAVDLVEAAMPLADDQTLSTAVDLLLGHDFDGLPVVSSRHHVTGWLTHRDVLRAYSNGPRSDSVAAMTHRSLRDPSLAAVTAR